MLEYQFHAGDIVENQGNNERDGCGEHVVHTNAMNRLRKADNRLTPEELEAKWQNSFSHKLGIWSLEHTPNGWPK